MKRAHGRSSRKSPCHKHGKRISQLLPALKREMRSGEATDSHSASRDGRRSRGNPRAPAGRRDCLKRRNAPPGAIPDDEINQPKSPKRRFRLVFVCLNAKWPIKPQKTQNRGTRFAFEGPKCPIKCRKIQNHGTFLLSRGQSCSKKCPKSAYLGHFYAERRYKCPIKCQKPRNHGTFSAWKCLKCPIKPQKT